MERYGKVQPLDEIGLINASTELSAVSLFSLYAGGSEMLCVNGEHLSPSAVLLSVLRCIHVYHHTGESVLRDNSKVTFHRPPCFSGKGTIKFKDTERPDPNK